MTEVVARSEAAPSPYPSRPPELDAEQRPDRMTSDPDRPQSANMQGPVGGNPPQRGPLVIPALIILLVGYVTLLVSGRYPQLHEALQLSSWLALPAALTLWVFGLLRIGMPLRYRLRSASFAPRDAFLQHVRRERLRADRSGAPLSIVIFSFGQQWENAEQVQGQAHALFNFLSAHIRETDILGYAGQDRIGLLLTETDAKGLAANVAKLKEAMATMPVSIVGETYPDRVFDSLLAEPQDQAERTSFFLDASPDGRRYGYPTKRALDIVGAVIAILSFSPLMLLTALAIKMSSPGPVIFRQYRIGAEGVPFVFFKFRSMTSGADDGIHREYVTRLISGDDRDANQGGAGETLYKLKSDPRVTWVGKLIRRSSIDELPQLFNVLKGDMSLVGPRPPIPYEAERYRSWHFRRIFEMRPGMTGLWQVKGRGRTTFDEMVRLDLQYVHECSLLLDLKILARTVWVVVRCTGAV
jgi:lipopolysaccharide/colanic/teichoic acid biosynthesis glycosyltransferase